MGLKLIFFFFFFRSRGLFFLNIPHFFLKKRKNCIFFSPKNQSFFGRKGGGEGFRGGPTFAHFFFLSQPPNFFKRGKRDFFFKGFCFPFPLVTHIYKKKNPKFFWGRFVGKHPTKNPITGKGGGGGAYGLFTVPYFYPTQLSQPPIKKQKKTPFSPIAVYTPPPPPHPQNPNFVHGGGLLQGCTFLFFFPDWLFFFVFHFLFLRRAELIR